VGGVPQEQALPALIPLLSSVVANLAQLGLPGALTGPVERGDVSSVERHLKTLEARAPELLALYRLVGRDVLRLAREKAKIDPAATARLDALFSEGRGNGGNGNGGRHSRPDRVGSWRRREGTTPLADNLT
jgi:hypothetical protein